MFNLLKQRITMVTGKGGVGKTSVAAALARFAARRGRRVLAIDIDKELETPSLLLELLGGGKFFHRDEPVRISANLSCARLSPRAGQHAFLRDQIPVKLLANAAIHSKHLNRFLMAAPSFQETGIIYRMMVYLRQIDEMGLPLYDYVVVDLPATGHALALTSLPKPLLKVFKSGPIERTIRESQGYFNNPAQTAVVIVTLPELLPVAETFELIKGLKRDRMKISGIFLNRLPLFSFSEEEKLGLRAFFEANSGRFIGEGIFRRMCRADEAVLHLRERMEEEGWGIPVYEFREQLTDDPEAILEGFCEDLRRLEKRGESS